MSSNSDGGLPVIGWREWVVLPELGIERVKAKIDTGARTSSLHAFHLKTYTQDGQLWVRFKVHPIQRNTRLTIEASAPILEFRKVRSSSGHASSRPVIVTTVEVLGQSWPIELTLANRDEMGFRMLLGREAVRQRFLVDAAKSYYCDNVQQRRKSKRRKRIRPTETGERS